MSDETAIQTRENGAPPADIDAVENALLQGDLSKLSASERKQYYREVCQSVGLNPLTKPFEYIRLNGQLQLYAKRDAAEQLRKINGVSVTDMKSGKQGSLYVCRVTVQDGEGRTDMATGAVDVSGAKGDRLANAIMKAETKAKRRATLSICGLGWLDETELDTIPSAKPAQVDHETGEIQSGQQGEPEKPSRDQLGEISSLMEEKGVDRAFVQDLTENMFGISSARDLTKDQASNLIDELQDLADAEEEADEYESPDPENEDELFEDPPEEFQD